MKNESKYLATGKRNGERGASLVEYALLVSLIALVSIVSVKYLGGDDGELTGERYGIAGKFADVGEAVAAAGSFHD